MVKINIHGDIVGTQDKSIEEFGYCNLAILLEKLEEADGEDVEIGINSNGGDVDEGFAMYAALRRYAKEKNASVTTLMQGACCSIATVIFLAGDRRITSKYIEPFVHNAWTFAVGDAGELTRVATDLEKVNNRIASFYAEHTNLTFQEAKNLMGADTYISPSEAVDIRFATEIEEVMKPQALRRFTGTKSTNSKSNKINNSGMKKNEKFFNQLKRFFASSENSLEVYTSTSEMIVFTDLEEGETPSVGDKATIDGEAAEGEHTLQDGTVYVFENGTLTEIKDEEEVIEEVEIEALRAENAKLKKSLSVLNARTAANEKRIKELTENWDGLKNLVSEISVDGKDNKDKTPAPRNSKGKGLAGAASRLKK